jgi:beta-galactosidase
MTSHPFGTGWRFGPASAGSSQPEFDDSGFAEVTLPHTVVPLSWRDWDPSEWERIWMYRKRFDAPPGAEHRRVFLDFAAAMTRATVTLNGAEVADHLGGYLPFSVEVSSLLRARGNVLAVRLDSTFNLNVPPDRPAPEPATAVDYWQPGGIYRDVRLRVVPRAFLADVFAKPVSVLDPAARRVVVQATVDAAAALAGPAHVAVRLLGDGGEIAAAGVPVATGGPGQVTVTAMLSGLEDVRLWDIDDPALYTVATELRVDGEQVDEHRVRTGFREARFALDGFYLNGRRVKLFGADRHQFFPSPGAPCPPGCRPGTSRSCGAS